MISISWGTHNHWLRETTSARDIEFVGRGNGTDAHIRPVVIQNRVSHPRSAVMPQGLTGCTRPHATTSGTVHIRLSSGMISDSRGAYNHWLGEKTSARDIKFVGRSGGADADVAREICVPRIKAIQICRNPSV